MNLSVLGDSAYPTKPYLFAPLLNLQGLAQQLYNKSHIRTRVKERHAFDLWKPRFSILAYGNRLNINTIITITIATAVLHNIAQRQREDVSPPVDNEKLDILKIIVGDRVPVPLYFQNDVGNASLLVRNILINEYFNLQ